jgi:hypothetical protein
MKRALERHECREARVIPVILRPVDWSESPFGKLQALPTDAKPVTSKSWGSLDEAFMDIAKGIRKEIENLKLQYLPINSRPVANESLESPDAVLLDKAKKIEKDDESIMQISQPGLCLRFNS